jgi:hypothetical protein
MLNEQNSNFDRDQICEFSSYLAKEHGIEIAIIHGFFMKYRYFLSQPKNDNEVNYPSITCCCSFLDFWDEEKIRHLVAQLYILKLI